MDDWLRTVAITLGVDPLDEGQIAELLDVARDVAHTVERKATPMATFLLGAAVQRRIGHGATAPDAFQDAVVELRTHLPGSDPA
jgi:Domain of unknown function (DUF6457)